MALANCVRCGNGGFETSIQSPMGSNIKMVFIQCSGCGGVVGTAPYHDPSAQHDRIINAIQAVARELKLGIDWRKTLA